MYRPVDPKVSFPKMEEKVLAFWQKNGIFEKSITQREGGEEFVFYDGPPFATGLPHFGHFVPSTVKDIIPRYQTMKGKQGRAPVRLGLSRPARRVRDGEGARDLGQAPDRGLRRGEVQRGLPFHRAALHPRVAHRHHAPGPMGRLRQRLQDHGARLHGVDLVGRLASCGRRDSCTEGHYILPYCPRCSTSLSNFELNLGGYLDVADPAITVKFPSGGRPVHLDPRVDHNALDPPVEPRPRAGSGYPLREGARRG